MVFSQPGFRQAGRIPYAVTLRALEGYFRTTIGRVEVWPRHSYVSGALVPFLSDLDVTLWLEHRPGAASVPAFRRSLKHATKLFPLLGEANIYVADEQELLRFGNVFELERDPILLERTHSSPIEIADWAQASVFVLRQIDADYANLAHNPASRERKWRTHFELLSSRLPEAAEAPVTIEGLFALAARLGAPGDEAAFAAEAARFIAIPHGDRTESQPVSDWWRALFPQWFCHKGFAYPPITGRALELFLAQLSWEIWGVWTQSLHNPLAPSFPNHLKRLQAVLGEATAGAAHAAIAPISDALEKLASLIQN
jgi:hypothetical protein